MESAGKGGGEKKKKKKKKKKTFFSHVFYLNYFYERKRVAVVVVVIVCCYSNETHAHIHTLIPAFSAHRYCDFLRFSILPIFSLALALYPSLECRRRGGGRKTPSPSPPFRIRFLSHFFRSFFDQTRVFPIALLHFSFRRGHEQRVQRVLPRKHRKNRRTTTRRPRGRGRGVHVAWKRLVKAFRTSPPTRTKATRRRQQNTQDNDDDVDRGTQKECVFVEKKCVHTKRKRRRNTFSAYRKNRAKLKKHTQKMSHTHAQ